MGMDSLRRVVRPLRSAAPSPSLSSVPGQRHTSLAPMHASAQVGATSRTHIRRGARHTRPHAFPPPPLVTKTSHRRTHLRSTAPCRIHRVFTGGAPVQGAELSACMQPRPLAHHGHIGGPYRLTYRLPATPFLSSSPTDTRQMYESGPPDRRASSRPLRRRAYMPVRTCAPTPY